MVVVFLGQLPSGTQKMHEASCGVFTVFPLDKLKKLSTTGIVLKFATIHDQPGVSSFIRLEVIKL